MTGTSGVCLTNQRSGLIAQDVRVKNHINRCQLI